MGNQAQADSVVDGKAKRIFLLSLFLFVIPLLGWLTSLYVESTLDREFRDALISNHWVTAAEYDSRGLSYLKACGPGGALAAAKEAAELCSGAEEIADTRLAAGATAALGAGLILLILLGKRLAGNDRGRLSRIFGPLVRIVMLVLAVSVIAQAGLLVYSIYTLEAAAIQRVHGGILAAIGLGALFGSFQLLKSGLGLLKEQPSTLRAELLSRSGHPEIYTLVEQVASKLKAEAPDHIVVGLEPNFFVTANPVQLLGGDGQTLRGRTLFMSLALLRILSKDEMVAVIGHELGHFRGQDTEYSLKFAPIYSRLTSALGGMGSSEGASSFALLPAMTVLNVCLSQFAETERTIGRERELLADQAGAEASSPDNLASALVKVSLYSGYWNTLTQQHVDILAEGRYFENLAEVYQGACANIHSTLEWDEAKPLFTEYVQPHPVDTHPPLGMRLKSLGVSIDDKDASIATPAATPASDAIPDAAEIEQRLSTLEIRWLEAIGAVVIPQAQQ